jgi:hypothetical protein
VPLTVAQDNRRGWIVVRGHGTLDFAEIVRLIGTTRAAVEHRMVPMLFDAQEVTGSLSDEDIERAAEAVREAVRRGGPRGHVAIVAPDDGVYAGMLRYETRCADNGVRVIRVFRQLPDAEQWLEVVSAARNLR